MSQDETQYVPEQTEVPYSEFVRGKFKTGRMILESWGIPGEVITEEAAHKMSMLHAVIGTAGEAGELLDAIKKYAMYNKPMDTEREDNIQEELGDMKFYNQALVNTLNEFGTLTDFGDSALDKSNRIKLDKRYKKGYSDKAAQERADKNEDDIEAVKAKLEGNFYPEKTNTLSNSGPKRITPLNWTDVMNWARGTIVVADTHHMLKQGLMENQKPESLIHWVSPNTNDVYFSTSASLMKEFVGNGQPKV